MGVEADIQFAVAEAFWAFMTQTNDFPKTETKVKQLYLKFKVLLLDSKQRRVSPSSALYSLRKIGLIRRRRKKEKENIIYTGKRNIPANKNLANKVQGINSAALAGLVHLKKKLKKLVANRDDLARNRGNIKISPKSENGIVYLGKADVGEEKQMVFIVQNESKRRHIFGTVVLGSTSEFEIDNATYEFMGKDMQDLKELKGEETVTIPVTIREDFPGVFHVVVAFWFRCGRGGPFHIIKFVKIDFKDDVVEALEPTEPYKKPALLFFDPNVELVKGVALPLQGCNYKVKLKQYRVPNMLKECLGAEREAYIKTFIKPSTTEKEHCEKLSILLHVEELQMREDIQRYNMEQAKLVPVPTNGCLALTVPGLEENRPSVICGDHLYVRKVDRLGRHEKKEYEGCVYHVERDAVHLKFDPEFHRSFVRNTSFGVRFNVCRTPLRNMHRAVENAPSYLKEIPCTDSWDCGTSNDPVKLSRFYNVAVSKNEQQQQAVEHIVAGTSRPYPYLVYGPPGTGKTVTLVEAINQILSKESGSKILACAPSNGAADLLLERVAFQRVIPKSKMVRLNAPSRSKATVLNSNILEFCKMQGDFFPFPPTEEIMEYRFVVTTLITAGRLVSLGIPKSHFTHIFIDEAGQGLEPQTLVPVAGLLGTNKGNRGQLVLAGDPKQLGPILRSPLAVKYGLGISFLERLMSPVSLLKPEQRLTRHEQLTVFACYNRREVGQSSRGGESSHDGESDSTNSGPYNTRMVTKLLNNYRSHPEIIEVPNELFYQDEIQACANVITRESLCQWEGLPNKGFPVVFEGIKGEDKREKKSPSFFNPHEVSAVLRYVKKLKECRVVDKDIGIISPYHQQVLKIREKLRGKPYDIRDIKVGSVEEFQGQERRVIIVSTVRASAEYFYLDADHKLGFLNMPKRFNVAITRAKALLVVIGNPYVLCKDPSWAKFIRFCMDNGSYLGCAFEMPEIDENVLANQLGELKLEGDVTNVGQSAANEEEDPEWRPPEA